MLMLHVFELVPVVLAAAASITCARRVPHCRRATDQVAMVLSVLCCIMLIVAQTSWWASSVLQMKTLGLPVVDWVWTVFNTTVTSVLLLLSWPRSEV